MRLAKWFQLLCLFSIPTLLSAQVNRLVSSVAGNPATSGWEVDPDMGALSVNVPIGCVTGEIPIPVAMSMNAAFNAPVNYYTTTQYIGGNIRYVTTPWMVYPQAIFGTCGFGYIGTTHSSGNSGPYVALENGHAYLQTEFSTQATYGGSLLTAWKISPAPAYTVNSSGSLLWATQTEPIATPLPISWMINGKTIGQMALQCLPVGFSLPTTLTYDLVADKNLLRIFVQIPTAKGKASVPMMWVDRFGHYVTFQWTMATTGLPSGVTSIVRVQALNQLGKGVTLRYANWSDTTSIHDLMRADFVNFSAPSALISGYSGFSNNNPSGFSSLGLIDAVTNQPPGFTQTPDVIAGLCARPTSIQIGDPLSIPEPGLWNNDGPQGPTLPSVDSGVESTSWQIGYDSNEAEISQITSNMGVLTTFNYGNYLVPNSTDFAYQTGNYFLNWTKEITGTVETDPQTAAVRTRNWSRTSNLTCQNISYQDYWSSVAPSDTSLNYVFTPYAYPPWGSGSLDFFNGFLQSLTLCDNSGGTVASMTCQSTTAANGGVGGGLDKSLSFPLTITSTRSKENNRQVSYTYTDATDLQPNIITSAVMVGSNYQIYQTQQYTFNPMSAMLETQQLKSLLTTRYLSGTQLLPTVLTTDTWDTQSPPLLQLASTYLDAGNYQHGQAYQYGEGKLSQQTVYHKENGPILPSPATLTVGYDTTTGQADSWCTLYQDVPITSSFTITKSAGNPDGAERPTTLEDEKGVITQIVYDLYGRVTSSTTSGLAPIVTTYPDLFTMKQVQAGLQTTSHLDGFGRLIRKDLPDGTYLTYAYDRHGRLASTTKHSSTGGTIQSSATYDLLGRPTFQTGFDGTIVSYTYLALANGNNQVTTSFNGTDPTVTITDPFGQVVQVTAPTGDVTTNTYDGMGFRTQVQLAPPGLTAQTRTFVADPLGRVSSKTEPETGTQTFQNFNALNQPTLITELGSPSRTRSLVYDGLGRLRSVSAGSNAGTATETFSYSTTPNNGLPGGAFLTDSNYTVNLASGSGYSVGQHFDYYPADQGALLQDEITTPPGLYAGMKIQYSYSNLGAVGSISYPSGRVVTYGFDSLGRATNVTSAFNGVTQPIVPAPASSPFDAWGNRNMLKFNSGTIDYWSEDSTNARPGSAQIIPVTGSFNGWTYSYDPATGRLTGTGEWSLVNDSLGRLSTAAQQWTQGNGLITAIMVPDAFGNNTSATDSDPGALPPSMNPFTFTGTTLSADPMPNNQLPGTTALGGLVGATYPTYGELGAIATGVSSNQSLTMAWEPTGRFAAVLMSGDTESYCYAPSGLRVARYDSLVPAQNRIYAYTAGGQLLGEYLNGGVWNRDVIYLAGRAIAEIDANGLVHELSSDALGSPRVITQGATGAIEGLQTFGPYGEYLYGYGTGYLPLTGYTGHIQTEPNGLIYMRGRFYSPAWHVFLNSDQGADGGQWSQYAYAGGNPFINVDPTGMWSLRSLWGDLTHGIHQFGHAMRVNAHTLAWDWNNGLRTWSESVGTAVACYYAWPMLVAWGGGGSGGAVFAGAAEGATVTAAYGGNTADIWRAGIYGGAMAGLMELWMEQPPAAFTPNSGVNLNYLHPINIPEEELGSIDITTNTAPEATGDLTISGNSPSYLAQGGQSTNQGNSMYDRFLDGYENAEANGVANRFGNAIGKFHALTEFPLLGENVVGAAQCYAAGWAIGGNVMATGVASTSCEIYITEKAIEAAEQFGKIAAGITNMFIDAY